MGRKWKAKSFKSGNSVALRVPAAVGMAPGEEWLLVEDGENFRLERVAKPKRKFNIEKVWGIGKHLDLQFIRDEDRVFEHRPLIWEDPEWTAKLEKRE